MKAMAERLNSLQINLDGSTPESIMYDVPAKDIPVKSYHTLFCPVYVLDSRLHNAGSPGPPKWKPRSRIGVYLGHSPFHAGSVALVFNPSTGRVSPQYHVVFDDEFSTITYMEEGTVPPNWSDLVEHSSELATNQDYNLAEIWLASKSNSLTEEMPIGNPVVDPFNVVPGQHHKGKRIRSESHRESVVTGATMPTSLADSEGDLPSPKRKRRSEQCTSSRREATLGMSRERADKGSANTSPILIDELKMLTRINLHEAGLRRSARLSNASKHKAKAHVTFGAKAKGAMLGLFTMISLVSSISLPSHQAGQNETSTDRLI